MSKTILCLELIVLQEDCEAPYNIFTLENIIMIHNSKFIFEFGSDKESLSYFSAWYKFMGNQ